MILNQLTIRMKECMKEKKKIELKVLRMAISAIKNERIKLGRDLTEEDEISVLKKELKTYTDPINELKKKDMQIDSEWEKELTESALIIKAYLPKEMDVEEVKRIIIDILNENNITFIREKGMAMKVIMPVLKGKVDGKVINEVVSEILK